MLTADMGNKVQCMMEHCSQQTAYGAHNDTEDAPSDNNSDKFMKLADRLCISHRNLLFL